MQSSHGVRMCSPHWALIKIITLSIMTWPLMFNTCLRGLSSRPRESEFQTPVASSRRVFAELESVKDDGIWSGHSVTEQEVPTYYWGLMLSCWDVIANYKTPEHPFDTSVYLILSFCELPVCDQIKRFTHLWSSVSTGLDSLLLPLRQSDMCLVCIAFASWVLKTANPQVGDAWKAGIRVHT